MLKSTGIQVGMLKKEISNIQKLEVAAAIQRDDGEEKLRIER